MSLKRAGPTPGQGPLSSRSGFIQGRLLWPLIEVTHPLLFLEKEGENCGVALASGGGERGT